MRYLMFALFAFVLGCSEKSSPSAPVVIEPDPSLGGRWSGGSNGLSMLLILSEDNLNKVTGSCQLSGTNTIYADVFGSKTYPNFTMNLVAYGFSSTVNYQGKFTDRSTLSGKLNGGGFVDWQITLYRQ